MAASADNNEVDPSTPSSDAPPTRRRRLRDLPIFAFLAVGVVTAVATVGWGIASMNYTGNNGVSHQMVSWSAPSADSVSVTFQVNSSKDAACLVRALDERHVEVGQDEVQVASGLRDVTHTLRTTRQAVAAEITSCREIGA